MLKQTDKIYWAIFFAVVFGVTFYLVTFANAVTAMADDIDLLFSATGVERVVKKDTNNKESKKPMEYQATFKTNKGEIVFELFIDKAPTTVENFVKLANSKFYDGVKFHRVVKGFMLQSGDPLSKDDSQENFWGQGGPGYTFADEFNDEKIVRGALAMANAGPDTNGSQFFIVTTEAAPWLDGKHTVFGRVISGMDIVDAIENVETRTVNSENSRPVDAIVIESISVK